MRKVTVALGRGKSRSTRIKYLIKLNIAIYGLDLAFCFCNLLARVYKVTLPLFSGLSLDMSLLSLCWHNKTLLPANCLKSPVSQLATSCNTLSSNIAVVGKGLL
jgi:hypothetical protein